VGNASGISRGDRNRNARLGKPSHTSRRCCGRPSRRAGPWVQHGSRSRRALGPPQRRSHVTRLARRAEVVPEARQLRGGDPGIDDQRAGPAVDDDRQVPEQLAPVDEDPVRDRCQHEIPYRRVLEPSLTSSSSSWSNVSGPQPVASDATAASSASFDG
jgi:hypothetical protein